MKRKFLEKKWNLYSNGIRHGSISCALFCLFVCCLLIAKLMKFNEIWIVCNSILLKSFHFPLGVSGITDRST